MSKFKIAGYKLEEIMHPAQSKLYMIKGERFYREMPELSKNPIRYDILLGAIDSDGDEIYLISKKGEESRWIHAENIVGEDYPIDW
ncbi:MAG: hypothetical protein GY679_01145 [Mycoplasma sp.]|nr:hypothetical protein [Mycoplasma sp.]